MSRRTRAKKGEKRDTATKLLWKSVYALCVLLGLVTVAQLASYLTTSNSKDTGSSVLSQQSALTATARINLSITALIDLDTRGKSALTKAGRERHLADLQSSLAYLKRSQRRTEAKAAISTLSQTLEKLRRSPEWKSGAPLDERMRIWLINDASRIQYEITQAAQYETKLLVQANEQEQLTTILLLMGSVVSAVSGTFLFARPMARKLSAVYQEHELAVSRVEVQRAELQTQNIKLREQTALAEEQRRDLKELTRLYKANANQFQSIFSGLPVPCFAMRPNGEVFEWNHACEKLFQYAQAEAVARKPWEQIFHGDDAALIRRHFDRAAAGFASTQEEAEISGPDGQQLWITVQSIPMMDMQGQVTGVLTAMTDLTERRKAELGLQESRNLIARMMESSPQIAYVLNLATGSISYANGQLAKLLNISVQEMNERGTTLLELVHPEDLELVRKHYDEVRVGSDQDIHTIEFRMARVDGTYRWVRTKETVFVRDARGNVTQILGSAEDVTDKRANEERLRLLSVVAAQSGSGVVIARPDRSIIFANPAYEEMTGYKSDELTGPNGKLLTSLFIPEQEGWGDLNLALDKQKSYYGEFRMERKDGEEFWSDFSMTPVYNQDNELTHWVAIQDDITSRRTIMQQIVVSRERLNVALQSSQSAVFDWNLTTNKLYLSFDFNTLLGYDANLVEDGEEYWLNLVHPVDKVGLERNLKDHLKGSEEVFRHEHRLRTKAGTYEWFMITGEIIESNDRSQPRRFIGTFTNISDRKHNEQRLAESEQRWNFALEGSGAGVWDWKIADSTLFLSRQWKNILGYAMDELPDDFKVWETHMHPEDRAAWFSDLEAHLQGNTEMLSTIVRMRHRNGHYLWCHDRGKVVARDFEGRPLRMIGMVTDITEQKVAEQQVIESEARFRSAIDALREGFMLQESNGNIRMSNPQAADMFDVELSDLLGDKLESILAQAVTEEGLPFLPSEFPTVIALKEARGVHNVIIGLNDGNQVKWLEVNAEPIFLPNAKTPYAAVALIMDVTDRRQAEEFIMLQMSQLNETQLALEARSAELETANERLTKLADTDGLTGLMNHRRFQEELEKQLDSAQAKTVPVSVALLDVDHFKQFNDTFGHLEGDEVLRSVARILKEAIGNRGTVARYGGEEFIVLLPDAKAVDAISIMEEAREAIASYNWTHRLITVSVGVETCTSASCHDRIAFVNSADQALYASKNAGRNRVTHATVLEEKAA
ncbi:MAG TPA: PAS domain S-box protein [Fimbriimonadaceae bacterium]|nr:PAS domain S-box protein [Fimbriimonadaceae bacterium]HRE94560.1 PAS domain S-box protein [Fimbriimonadaceae bacterium]